MSTKFKTFLRETIQFSLLIWIGTQTQRKKVSIYGPEGGHIYLRTPFPKDNYFSPSLKLHTTDTNHIKMFKFA